MLNEPGKPGCGQKRAWKGVSASPVLLLRLLFVLWCTSFSRPLDFFDQQGCLPLRNTSVSSLHSRIPLPCLIPSPALQKPKSTALPLVLLYQRSNDYLNEIKVLAEQEVACLYLLSWPIGDAFMVTEEAFVIPVAKRRGGVLLAVPVGFIPEKELEEGLQASEDAVIGPSRLLKLPGVEEDDNGTEIPSEADVPVILVDFNMSVFQHLKEYDPSTDTQMIQSFLDDAPQIMPMSSPLLQQALEWMTEEVSGRLQFYSAEEQVPMTPVPPTKRVTTAALADQISPGLEGQASPIRGCHGCHPSSEGRTSSSPSTFPSDRRTVQLAGVHESCGPIPESESHSNGCSSRTADGCATARRPQPSCGRSSRSFWTGGSTFDDSGHTAAESSHECFGGPSGGSSRPASRPGIIIDECTVNQRSWKERETSTGAGKQVRRFLSSSCPTSSSTDQATGPIAANLRRPSQESHLQQVPGEARRFCRSEGVCHPHVVVGADWRRYGGEGSWWSSRIAGPYAGKPRASQPRRGKMGPRISSFSTRRTSPGTLHVSDFKCQSSAQSICSVMPPALGNVCPGVCQGDGCDFHPPCRDISTTRPPPKTQEEKDKPAPKRTRFPKKPKKEGEGQ